ncbi:hypothetical protein ACFLXH_05855 [Chloroflexota bacterium]
MDSKNICCLCGLRKTNITKEHLFPRGLFNIPRPTNLPKRIPTCYECNNSLSKDEEDFRLFLTAGMAYESNVGKRMWVEKIRPSLKGRLKQRKYHLVKKHRTIEKSGNVIELPIIALERDSGNRVLRKFAKGLYYLDTQQVLPSEIEIDVGYYSENPDILSQTLDEARRGACRVELGQGEVVYWRGIIKDNPEVSLTWIRFYEDKIFLICTSRQSTF